ncbi:hypothetical protein BFP97_06120 [Roseivirga sp. 4D4]|uniref:hypothetical protein n=1 Tax=Roseivirga sp. 4D4 TaxID=1889784 RepID=UPI000853797D|nr:hypothetical protein [Roseivirga sp. 4D4]OEK01108.1 hypothetical protein BFP97_06120 [Roseivirga sp. 4D4]
MRLLLVLITSVVTSVISSNTQSEGYVYKSELASLTIEFPGKPEFRVKEVEGGSVEEALFVADDVEYALMISKSNENVSIEKELEKFGSRLGMAKKLSADFHRRSQGYIEGLTREEWELGANKGAKMTFKSRRHDFHYRAIIIASTVIEVFVKADANRKEETTQYDQTKVDRFTGSLKLN